jgi:hypothetical protein
MRAFLEQMIKSHGPASLDKYPVHPTKILEQVDAHIVATTDGLVELDHEVSKAMATMSAIGRTGHSVALSFGTSNDNGNCCEHDVRRYSWRVETDAEALNQIENKSVEHAAADAPKVAVDPEAN